MTRVRFARDTSVASSTAITACYDSAFASGSFMTMWVKLATFSTGLDADVARSTLEDAGIPVMVRGNQVGAFGGGFQGPVVGGVELHVPDSALEHARELVESGDED